MIENHYHNDIDSNRLNAKEALVGAPQAAIAQVAGTAGSSYTSAEQTILNNTVTALNKLLAELKTLGITL